MTEEWRTISGFSKYQVSNVGNVKSFGYSEAILRHSFTTDGYRFVTLYNAGKRYTKRISRLVCEAFNGSPLFKGALALHRDDNKDNNTPDNLYWGNDAQNAQDGIRNQTKPRGEQVNTAKLTWEKVREMRRLYKQGRSVLSLSLQFGVSSPCADSIMKEKSWKEPTNALS